MSTANLRKFSSFTPGHQRLLPPRDLRYSSLLRPWQRRGAGNLRNAPRDARSPGTISVNRTASGRNGSASNPTCRERAELRPVHAVDEVVFSESEVFGQRLPALMMIGVHLGFRTEDLRLDQKEMS
ncbi:hypothetical protein [Nocardia bhagyanarayanae]|uniref:hypothetical protein n=1 Tax=Nocardia bhagyanarayanae TaxID=1215925 RepID=UPI00114E6956|nr:hypothetical protein [Nocardia bhagyanarayanae]